MTTGAGTPERRDRSGGSGPDATSPDAPARGAASPDASARGAASPDTSGPDATVPPAPSPPDPAPAALPADAGRILLPLARGAIAARLRLEAGVEDGFEAEPTPAGPGVSVQQLDEHPAWLDAPGAAFVTLHLDGELRGCIGTLEAFRPLAEDVRINAVNAAFRDPRFLPLAPEEFDLIRVEVSVLSAPEPLDDVRSEARAVAALRPGVDGVILRSGSHRATFLPQVWQQLPSPHDFLTHLRRKAGLRPDHWDEHTTVSRYTVQAWEEE